MPVVTLSVLVHLSISLLPFLFFSFSSLFKFLFFFCTIMIFAAANSDSEAMHVRVLYSAGQGSHSEYAGVVFYIG